MYIGIIYNYYMCKWTVGKDCLIIKSKKSKSDFMNRQTYVKICFYLKICFQCEDRRKKSIWSQNVQNLQKEKLVICGN